MAAAGVAVRIWSSSRSAGRMPGVTITHVRPSALRNSRISWDDATQPSSPAARPRSASRSTWASTGPGTPTSVSSARRSRLVSTVTPITSGRGTAKSFDALAAASVAARSIAAPPEAWTLRTKTPRRVASRTAPATVFGMSWYLRSRKTRKPRLSARSTATGPAAVKSWLPILQPVTSPARRSSSASASSSRSTSSATRRRSRGSAIGVVLLQAAHLVLALEQRLDGPDRRLGAVHREVVGDVVVHRGAADEVRVLARAAVLGRVEEQRDLAALHEVDHVGPVALGHLVDQLDGHALALQHARGAGGGHQR